MKKCLWFLLILLTLCLGENCLVYATNDKTQVDPQGQQAQGSPQDQQENGPQAAAAAENSAGSQGEPDEEGAEAGEGIQEEITQDLMEDMELDQVQKMVDELLKDQNFDLGDALKKLMSGDEVLTKDYIMELVRKALFSQLDQQRSMIFQILLLVIAAAVFANFASAFDNGQIGEISFYVVYLLLFAILVENFKLLAGELNQSLDTMVNFMQGLTPAYFLAVAASSGASTAAMFYQMVLILVYVIQWLILNFLLPGVNLYVLLELVNHLSKEDVLTKLAELLRTIVEWSMKTLLGVVVGLQVIQGMVTPVIDSLKRTTLGKTASAIPGIGNAINSVTEIVITSAVLVRNCLGVVFLIILVLWGITPILHYACTSLLYKLLAALAQPVSDKRIVACLTTVGEGCSLLLRLLITTEVLCMITIAILATTFGS